MTKRLLEVYEGILNLAGLKVTPEGFVSLLSVGENTADQERPFIISGKRLVLPTVENLRNPSPKTMVFHPLRENVMRGESVVLREYRRVLAVRVNLALYDLMSDLVTLAMTPSKHKDLTPSQSEILSILKEANKGTREALDKIINAVQAEDEKTRGTEVMKSAIRVYVKQSGKKNDQAFTRLGVVSFPIFNDLKAGKDPYGVSMAKKHRELLIELFRYIFPDINGENHYGFGSNSDVAPAFEAMFRSFLNIYQRIASVITAFEGSGAVENSMSISMAEFNNIADLNLVDLDRDAQTVPMQAGNEGSLSVDAEEVVEKKTRLSPAEINSRRLQNMSEDEVKQPEQPTYREEKRPSLPSDYRRDSGRDSQAYPTEERKPEGNTIKFDDMMNNRRRNNRDYYDRRYNDRGRSEYDRCGGDYRSSSYGNDGNSLDPYADRGRSEYDRRGGDYRGGYGSRFDDRQQNNWSQYNRGRNDRGF